jgi:hypothetical protein
LIHFCHIILREDSECGAREAAIPRVLSAFPVAACEALSALPLQKRPNLSARSGFPVVHRGFLW